MSAGRNIADLAAREDGGILVFVAMLTPVVLLFLAFAVDIGNWWVHKRHLQLQVDAAALAGGALLGECFTDPAAANVAIANEATRFGGAAGSSYNEQLGGTQKGSVALAYQSNTYPSGAADPAGDTETSAPVRHGAPDVRRQGERGGHPAPASPAPRARRSGDDARRPDGQRARPGRAEAGRDPGGNASRRCPRSPLQLRLRDVRQRGHGRRARHGPADEGRLERRRPALEHDDADLGLDPLGARRRPGPARRRRRPDRRLRHALHRVLRHRLHQRCRPHPRLERGHGARGTERLAARRARARRTRTSRPPTAAPGSRPRSTSAPCTRSPAPASPPTSGRASTAPATTRSPRAARPGSSRGPRPAGSPSPGAGRTSSS